MCKIVGIFMCFWFFELSPPPSLSHSQELLYVVPFVAKVLESCAESRVFKPPNPWTMAIMRVLSELHSAPDLKLNLRFEVEVLCKHLNMEIAVSSCTW